MKSALAFIVLAAAASLAGCGSDNPSGPTTLMIQDLTIGTGATATSGDTLTVDYVGTLESGQKFDSSIDRGQPYTFLLGVGAVIAGWDQGIPGMKVGGKRRLTIPPSLGYGSQANGPIPGNSTLIFEVTLLSIAGK